MVSFPEGSSTPTNKFYICKTVSVTESSKKTKAPVRHLEGHPLLWLPLSLRQLPGDRESIRIPGPWLFRSKEHI